MNECMHAYLTMVLESYYLLVFCPTETKKPMFSSAFLEMRKPIGKPTTSTLVPTPESEKCHFGGRFQFHFPSKTPLSFPLLLPPCETGGMGVVGGPGGAEGPLGL